MFSLNPKTTAFAAAGLLVLGLPIYGVYSARSHFDDRMNSVEHQLESVRAQNDDVRATWIRGKVATLRVLEESRSSLLSIYCLVLRACAYSHLRKSLVHSMSLPKSSSTSLATALPSG